MNRLTGPRSLETVGISQKTALGHHSTFLLITVSLFLELDNNILLSFFFFFFFFFACWALGSKGGFVESL